MFFKKTLVRSEADPGDYDFTLVLQWADSYTTFAVAGIRSFLVLKSSIEIPGVVILLFPEKVSEIYDLKSPADQHLFCFRFFRYWTYRVIFQNVIAELLQRFPFQLPGSGHTKMKILSGLFH